VISEILYRLSYVSEVISVGKLITNLDESDCFVSPVKVKFLIEHYMTESKTMNS
jgi:hypothetical protein